MAWSLLVGIIGVVAITAVYFLWARKLPQQQPAEQKQ